MNVCVKAFNPLDLIIAEIQFLQGLQFLERDDPIQLHIDYLHLFDRTQCVIEDLQVKLIVSIISCFS